MRPFIYLFVYLFVSVLLGYGAASQGAFVSDISGINHLIRLHHIQKEKRPRLHRCESLKSGTETNNYFAISFES